MKVRTRIKDQIKIWESQHLWKLEVFVQIASRHWLKDLPSYKISNHRTLRRSKFLHNENFIQDSNFIKNEKYFDAFWLRNQKCHWNKYYCCQEQLGTWAKSNREWKIITSRNKCMSISFFTVSCRRMEENNWAYERRLTKNESLITSKRR